MTEKIFPKRREIRENFPPIHYFDGTFITRFLPQLIREQLILLGDDPDKEHSILVVPPYKPDALLSMTNKCVVSNIGDATDDANKKLAHTPYRFVPAIDVIMLSVPRSEGTSPLYWENPAWAL